MKLFEPILILVGDSSLLITPRPSGAFVTVKSHRRACTPGPVHESRRRTRLPRVSGASDRADEEVEVHEQNDFIREVSRKASGFTKLSVMYTRQQAIDAAEEKGVGRVISLHSVAHIQHVSCSFLIHISHPLCLLLQ